MTPFVLITGASSGIGLDSARLLIAQGYRVIGTVRRTEDGARIRKLLGTAFIPLLLDVTDQAALPAAVRQVESLVGEAGLAALVLAGGDLAGAAKAYAESVAIADSGSKSGQISFLTTYVVSSLKLGQNTVARGHRAEHL